MTEDKEPIYLYQNRNRNTAESGHGDVLSHEEFDRPPSMEELTTRLRKTPSRLETRAHTGRVVLQVCNSLDSLEAAMEDAHQAGYEFQIGYIDHQFLVAAWKPRRPSMKGIWIVFAILILMLGALVVDTLTWTVLMEWLKRMVTIVK